MENKRLLDKNEIKRCVIQTMGQKVHYTEDDVVRLIDELRQKQDAKTASIVAQEIDFALKDMEFLKGHNHKMGEVKLISCARCTYEDWFKSKYPPQQGKEGQRDDSKS